LATNSITNPTIHKNKATQKIIKNYVFSKKEVPLKVVKNQQWKILRHYVNQKSE